MRPEQQKRISPRCMRVARNAGGRPIPPEPKTVAYRQQANRPTLRRNTVKRIGQIDYIIYGFYLERTDLFSSTLASSLKKEKQRERDYRADNMQMLPSRMCAHFMTEHVAIDYYIPWRSAAPPPFPFPVKLCYLYDVSRYSFAMERWRRRSLVHFSLSLTVDRSFIEIYSSLVLYSNQIDAAAVH